MVSYIDSVKETSAFLAASTGIKPEVGFLTGTGLGAAAASIKTDLTIAYSDIPNFPVSTSLSHQGELLMGTLENRSIMAMKGRFHLFEGYSPRQVTFPIRVMQELGIRCLILSNASGGINSGFARGDIMLIKDHVNLTGCNPLTGPNIDAWGNRFPDMSRVYSTELSNLARQIAHRHAIPMQSGVYAGLPGPCLETPAETRYLQRIGCDAVGFSTVLEAITGVHAGMTILGLAVITNINDPDTPDKISVPDILRTAEAAATRLDTLVSGIVGSLPPE